MRVHAAAAAAIAALAALAAPAAFAAKEPPADPNPPLAGELLTGTIPQLQSANCNETGTSVFTYRVTGVATGPYPGTFEETVTATVGPQTDPTYHPVPGLRFGPITHITARFTIFSPLGTVTGTKQLYRPSMLGVCDDQALSSPTGCTATFFQADAVVTYDARITTPLGTSTDHGIGNLSAGGINTRCGGQTTFESGAFNERFTVSLGPVLPTTKEQCREGGFAAFGEMFKNQGECVAFVATRDNS